MTTLAITPNWKNKSAKFKGTVAAGEHVSVTIQNDNGEGGEFIADASTLRLRVVDPCNGRTLAIFPEPVPEGETPETWDADLTPLTCTLNLNTVQMLKAVPPAANVPLLFVLDDYDNNTLYFKEQFPVEHWPRLRGEEEPTDLDNYKDIIADFNTRLDGYDTRITGAENAAQAATANASAAAATANQAVGIANQAVDKAETAQNSAAASAEAAHNSALAAEEAQEAAESAAESINSPDATLTEDGVAADAKAAGEAIAAEKERAETAEAAEETRAKGVESGLRTDLTAAQKAIDDEAVLRAAADADLNANKADKATTYTKTEVDTKIAGVQTFQKYLVQTLPDPDEADMKGLYLVPTGETSEEGDLCEEWTVVEEDGEKRWEKIGGTTVDLSDYYDKDAVDNLLDDKQDVLTFDNAPTSGSNNPVKSGGIWTAIWGALSALPTGFSSLYDWCVAQLGLKRDYTDLSYDTTETVEVPALHATMTSQQGGQVIVEYDLLCTEEVPDPPQIGHSYTWKADGAAFYVTQGVSALQTTWVLYSYTDEPLGGVTTQNATQGFYPDVEFRPSNAVITIHKTTAQKTVTVEDELALKSDIPAPSTATPAMDGTGAAGTSAAFARGDHVHPTDTSRVPTSRKVNGKALSADVTLTGADIAVSGTDATKISAALAGKLDKSGDTMTGSLSVKSASGESYIRVESGPSYVGILCGGSTTKIIETEDYTWRLPTDDGTFSLSAGAGHTGNLAALDAQGNPTDAGWTAGDLARYSLVAKTIDNGAVSLDDRAINAVAVSSSLASLTVNFPTATSGKARDFGLRLTVASGITTAPELALPQGVTCENADGEAPEIGADGAATILYFTETASGVFLVKGEVVTAIS